MQITTNRKALDKPTYTFEEILKESGVWEEVNHPNNIIVVSTDAEFVLYVNLNSNLKTPERLNHYVWETTHFVKSETTITFSN